MPSLDLCQDHVVKLSKSTPYYIHTMYLGFDGARLNLHNQSLIELLVVCVL